MFYVGILVLKLFHETYLGDVGELILEDYNNLKLEFEECNEEIAFSILQLKKK